MLLRFSFVAQIAQFYRLSVFFYALAGTREKVEELHDWSQKFLGENEQKAFWGLKITRVRSKAAFWFIYDVCSWMNFLIKRTQKHKHSQICTNTFFYLRNQSNAQTTSCQSKPSDRKQLIQNKSRFHFTSSFVVLFAGLLTSHKNVNFKLLTNKWNFETKVNENKQINKRTLDFSNEEVSNCSFTEETKKPETFRTLIYIFIYLFMIWSIINNL